MMCSTRLQRALLKRALSLVTLAMLAGSVVGCGLFNESAYRLDLAPSSWTVEAIDNQRVLDRSLRISFDEGDVVVIDTPCGSGRGTYALDTDGSALAFGPLMIDHASCSAEQIKLTQTFVDALSMVVEWSVVTDDAIRFLGERELDLRRAS